MKPAEWIDLIQKFPPDDFDGFGIIMENGLEITLQSVLQLNSDHMLIRGRTVGSTDAGRYFYVPYDRISCIVYNRMKKEEEVLSWYDGQPSGSAPPPVEEEAPELEEAPLEEAPAPETTPAPAANRTASPAARPSVPSLKPAARPASPPKPAPTPPGAARQPVAQEATGLKTSALANAQNNPIKAALLERLRARRLGQEPPAPEKK